MSIAENAAQIEERIQKACAAAGRKRDEITLMGVTKFLPANKVEEAYNAGIHCFGESRVKEAAEKFDAFKASHSIQLHLIGSLQRNKAKSAALFFDCVQSIDREEIIAELEKHSAGREHPLDVLLELHTGEETKSGFADMDSLFRAAQMVLESPHLKARGLMTMAPFTQDTALIHKSFRQVVNAQKELERRFPPKEKWECLSMGMSNDFEMAIEEGSTMLRVGSLLFKE
jgi:pyridoxal phosphate enzyme (YggS family)